PPFTHPHSTLFPYTTLFRSQFDNGYPLPSLGPFIRFPDRDTLSRILANLRSSTNSAVGVKTSALDSAFLDDQHFGNKVIADSKIDRKSTRLNSSHQINSYAV